MTTTFESISLNGLRLSHLRQLASYVHARDVEGWYYGAKDQFEKRHSDIVSWVDSAVRYAESEGVKMPNNTIHEDGETERCPDCNGLKEHAWNCPNN